MLENIRASGAAIEAVLPFFPAQSYIAACQIPLRALVIAIAALYMRLGTTLWLV